MKVFLETYGCQMNVYDSELVRSILDSNNYSIVKTLDDAQIVLLNTCAIRENAHQKIYNRLDQIGHLKKKGQIQAVGVLGCMAQNLKKDLSGRAPIVDVVAGPDSYKKLPELLDSVVQKGERGFDFSLSEYETYSDIAPSRMPGINAWIAIMRGCDNFCTFCVVPYTRGRERSRSPESIVAEAKSIAEQGFPQVTLLGQNVNSYNHEGRDFADLMEKIALEVPELPRVRFTSPHPKDFSRKLLKVMAKYPALCNHIHLPLQAGNNQILEKMNRTYTKQEFLDLADEIRQILPGVYLSTDVICGFCGETEEDFLDTFEVMEKVRFDSAFIFKYSERKNTIASRKYPDDVPEEQKIDRVMRLNNLQRQISLENNEKEIGKEFEVLIEHKSKKNPKEWFGRTDHGRGVVFAAPDHQPGNIVTVKVIAAGTHTLKGEMIPSHAGV